MHTICEDVKKLKHVKTIKVYKDINSNSFQLQI